MTARHTTLQNFNFVVSYLWSRWRTSTEKGKTPPRRRSA